LRGGSGGDLNGSGKPTADRPFEIEIGGRLVGRCAEHATAAEVDL